MGPDESHLVLINVHTATRGIYVYETFVYTRPVYLEEIFPSISTFIDVVVSSDTHG